MNKDDIMRMALEAGLGSGRGVIQITKFAALIAAAEREACAELLEETRWYPENNNAEYLASVIRARGQS
jgi:hypothetical protein